jgi:radical SAM protein with 4Fe4S-binding SPASM domain
MSVRESFDFLIQWHLTEQCNLRCTHCYQEDTKTGELSLPEIKETITEISEMFSAWAERYEVAFSPSFNITGGEPFLRKDLFDILREIRGRGYDIYLLTNGTLIDESRARALKELEVKGVQVSLEGPEETHRMIRGKGSFAASLRGIRHLLDAGLRVTVNTTLSAINAEHFIKLAELSAGLGVQRLGFSRLVPSGRGAGLVNSMLSREVVRKLYERISSLSPNGLEFVTGDPVATQMKTSLERGKDSGSIPAGGCAAGVSGLTFLPDGTIVPCRRLQIPIGNVKKDSLREVWAASPVLEALRDKSKYKGKCGTCPRWADCRGCRAIAYAYAQSKGQDDFLAEDPQCFIDGES